MVVVAALPAAGAGCGSLPADRLPPAAGPARAPALRVPPAGRVVPGRGALGPALVAAVGPHDRVVLRPRLRRLERGVESAPAGVGPTNVACAPVGFCYVADTRGDALLVYALHPRLALVRRVYLRGAPYALAIDQRRQRLYVTLTQRNEVVELPAHGRPHPLRSWPTVRGPEGVGVDPRTGRVAVTGAADGVRQLLSP